MQSIKHLIETKLPHKKIEVIDLTGTEDHLGLLVVSDEFTGKPLLSQHRMIMEILGPEFKAKLHAVKLETYTVDQYEKKYGVKL